MPFFNRLFDRLRVELAPLALYRLGSLLAFERSRIARWRGKLDPHKAVRVRVRKSASPFWIRFGTSDPLVLAELFGAEEYAGLKTPLGAAPRVLDLGANIGLSVRLWLERYPGASVVAVEPDPGNIEIARMNVAEVAAGDRVKLVQGFAAAESGVAYLSGAESGCGVTKIDRPAEGDAAAIPCYSMAQLLEQLGGDVDLMKCDIEGSERELFGHCAGWIGRVRNLLVETHKPYTMSQLVDDLARNGGKLKQVYYLKRDSAEVAGFVQS